MHIFIDESGTFAPASQPGAWCVVAAYVVGSRDRVEAEEVLNALKAKVGRTATEEIKRRDVSEEQYFQFLEDLETRGGFLVSVATDAGRNERAVENQMGQVRIIRESIDRRKALKDTLETEALAAAMKALSPQLYVEIVCRMYLAWLAVSVGVAHYVQTEPQTLCSMDWCFDAKGGSGAAFEKAHGPLMAGLASDMSKAHPMPYVAGADYSNFGRFIRGGAAALRPTSPGQTRAEVMVVTRRLYRERQAFVDSARSRGVQIADLLVSGIAALLRGKFSDQERAARCLGRLTARMYATGDATYLISFGDPATPLITDVARKAVKDMNAVARAVFKKRPG
ncbi:DUF3800 domain-containing protein [Rhodanobacter sp. MP7CTX1]|uniref:DUF3800 domain-containing protein n=1 Tax=Rhodanobacter sp. MP7CTX1 TaxID=2723084 RepID=UPI001609FA45|nr:hypothetical protein [Rhodanobacter sp. MP7CTX1]